MDIDRRQLEVGDRSADLLPLFARPSERLVKWIIPFASQAEMDYLASCTSWFAVCADQRPVEQYHSLLPAAAAAREQTAGARELQIAHVRYGSSAFTRF